MVLVTCVSSTVCVCVCVCVCVGGVRESDKIEAPEGAFSDNTVL